jgi:hypothetical protein
MSEDRAHHPARKVGRDEHVGRTKATTRIFPPKGSGLVNDQRLDLGTAVFAAAPEDRGDMLRHGESQYVIPTSHMPSVKAKFKDLRKGTNDTGDNPGNLRLSSAEARAGATEKYHTIGNHIQDNEGNHVPNRQGNPPL